MTYFNLFLKPYSNRRRSTLFLILLWSAMTAQAAEYTYTVNRSGACTFGCTGNLTATGTITVNNLGSLTSSHITNWSLTLSSPSASIVLTPANSTITYGSADLYATETEFYLATAPLSGSHEKFGIKANDSSEWILSDEEGGGAPYEFLGTFTASGNEMSFLPIPEGPGNKVLIGIKQAGGGKAEEEEEAPSSYVSPPPAEVRVSVEVDGSGEGLVSSNVGIQCAASDCQAVSYNEDATGRRCDENKCSAIVKNGTTTVAFTPQANYGSEFSSWGGHPDCADGQIQVTGGILCIAYFRLSPRRLSITPVGEGVVTSRPVGIECGLAKDSCEYAFKARQTITLVPTPNVGWQFAGFQGDCDLQGQVVMDQDKHCQAQFVPIPPAPPVLPPSLVTLTVTKTGSGWVTSDSGINCGDDCLTEVVLNSNVTLLATAESGYQFANWGGSEVCTGSQNPLTFLVTQSQTCQANFEAVASLPSYLLTLTKPGQGEGTVSSTPPGIACGDDCQEEYPNGQVLTLVATPATGSKFVGWQEDCQGETAETSLTMTGAKTCAAQFDRLESSSYNLTITKPGQGQGTVSSTPAGIACGDDCQEAYPSGQVLTLVATPATDSKFAGWKGNCQGETAEISVTMTTAKICAAQFDSTISPSYSLTVTKPGQGQGTVSSKPLGIFCGEDCQEEYANGQVLTLIATAAAGSKFAGWQGDCQGEATEVSLTMTGVKTCAAQFDQLPNSTAASVTTTPPSLESPTPGAVTSPTSISPVVTPTPVTSAPVDSAPVTSAPVTTTPVTSITMPIIATGGGECQTSSNLPINGTCNVVGQTVTMAEVSPSGSLSGATIAGTVTNQGWVSNLTVLPDGVVKGGVVSGYVTNQGLLTDFEFRGAKLKGGKLGGKIRNTSTVGGYFEDVELQAGTQIQCGKLKGHIRGNPRFPAQLEHCSILAGSRLEYVTLGENVKLGQSVTLGEGVQFLQDTTEEGTGESGEVPDDTGTEAKTATLPTLGQGYLTNSTGQTQPTSARFSGGTSVHEINYRRQLIVKTTDRVHIKSQITVATPHINQPADVIVYLSYQPLSESADSSVRAGTRLLRSRNVRADASSSDYLVLDAHGQLLPWDGNPQGLIPFLSDITLPSVLDVDIYQDVMPNTGTFYITVGYRLSDGTLVTSDEEIEVTVNPPVASTSTGMVPAGNWECLPGVR